MNVLFVSQCSKRALTETRRILDQFAERRGDRTWQTPITAAGLDTVRKLLRQSARKNTAVACHWIRGRDHSELLWIVGDGRQFNAEGAVPTNTTASNVLRAEDESHWHHLPLMTALAALAALVHDLGKATRAFQDRLRNPGLRERNHYRHEWVSVRLFQAFVGRDDDAAWLRRLAEGGADAQAFEKQWTQPLLRDGIDEPQAMNLLPFAALQHAPLAQAVAWLVLTHHRLPCMPVPNGRQASDDEMEPGRREYCRFGARPRFVNSNEIEQLLQSLSADWNEPREKAEPAKVQAHWDFPQGLPVTTAPWRKQAARYATKLQELTGRSLDTASLGDPFTLHLSRLCLMLADHHYSSIEDEARRQPFLNPGYPLYANTRRKSAAPGAASAFNQTLDEHLLGVQAHATLVARSLPTLARSLPTLRSHRGLKKRSSNARFQWQDKAADLAASVRHRAASQGGFIVNMASTGCGKTLGHARIMNALADPGVGMRCAFAIGLRTLTLQTGRVFQNDLGLGDDQLAIKVGGAASRALFEYWEAQAEATGSASRQALLDEGGQVLFDGNDQHPLLQRLTDDAQVRSLIAAPVLACTVDHLTPATESLRGGRQIAHMQRLKTGDLVLDEPDDFDMADLPALTRLVHWAGLLGSRVLLSSATLPPALVEGLYLAYRAGREVFQRHRGERPGEPVAICCLWVDEFHQQALDCADGAGFRTGHEGFVQKRVAQLARAEVRRLAAIAALPAAWQGLDLAARRRDFARIALEHAWQLHQQPRNHGIDPASGKHVSFGLIRMANIEPLFDVAVAMVGQGAPAPGVRVHLCVYHSQFPLLARSSIERQLDTVLDRRSPDGTDPVFQRPAIRALLDACPEPHHLFIVLGSPVTEVGRDHDYDWAVVEPSSMRSLIQLAGRLRRHRPGAVQEANMRVLDRNLRSFEQQPDRAAFCKPGFEMDKADGKADTARYFHLRSHDLQSLLAKHTQGEPLWPVDARARIEVAREQFKPTMNLVDLEHARMHDTMLPRPARSPDATPVLRAASLHWASPAGFWLTGLLPQFQRFRHDPLPRVDVVFLPDEEEEGLQLHRVVDGQRRGEKLYVLVQDSLLYREPLDPRKGTVTAWGQADLMRELVALAEGKGLALDACASKYATASLPDKAQGWRWHDVLGFVGRA
jgi:CRISPR-associated endonuclease/helicase Cas3